MPSDFDPDRMVRQGIQFLGAKKDPETGDYVGLPILGKESDSDSKRD